MWARRELLSSRFASLQRACGITFLCTLGVHARLALRHAAVVNPLSRGFKNPSGFTIP